MIVHDVDQNSTAWDILHLGRPTASEFHKILTPTGELSKQSDGYAYYKLAETIMNAALTSISHLEWIDRGKQLEPEAVKQYEFINDATTQKVGFVTTDDGRFGCSPDRFVIRNNKPVGLLEVKCPAPQTQVEYWAVGPGPAYRPQMFGQMWICEMDWCDFYSYHPDMRPVQHRTVREPLYMSKLTRALKQFDDRLQTLLMRARQEGFFDLGRTPPSTPVQRLADELQGIGDRGIGDRRP